ncbi:T9SS type A sorting domain-containing protein [Candidatus Poribacteria bacterium]|nr:T9SS type A sorting domain-containing protein [Candidatus Poribacteria bacterium]
MLKTFFVIGLMLFAAMLSVTATAAPNDGMGKVMSEQGTYPARDTDADGTITTAEVDALTLTAQDPLNAGSTMNGLRFTYTARDMGDDAADAADDMGYNMRDGMVRIAFPGGWKVPDTFLVEEGSVNADGTTFTAAATDAILYDKRTGTQTAMDDDAHVKRIGFKADAWITVKLTGETWVEQTGADAGRAIRITFMEVQTGVPSMLSTVPATGDASQPYTFSSSSMAMNGTFLLLADANQPKVNVGNILGDKGATDGSRDTLDKKVVITPKQEFVGEMNTKFTISFTAPGPIYAAGTTAAVLTITLDAGVGPSFGTAATDDAADATSAYMIRSSSGVTVALGSGASETSIPLDITKINNGQKITVTYSRKAALEQPSTPTNPSFTLAITIPGVGADTTTAPTREGGTISAKDGSGMLALSPIAIEVGSQRRDITLTYTAYTDLMDKDIKVMPDGIVLEAATGDVPAKLLQTGSSTGYGYVSGSMNPDVVDGGMAIMWTNIDLKKGKTLKATIKRVDIKPEAGEYEWAVYVYPTGLSAVTTPTLAAARTAGMLREDGNVDGDEMPILSVTKTAGASVNFEVIEGHENLRAGADNATIKFRFTAEDTVIRDGRVSLTIPSALGSAPTITKKVAGRVMVEKSEGTILQKDQDKKPGISGRTINVGIKRMDVGESVTVVYGSPADDGKPAVLSDISGDVKVTGTFRTSANASTRTAGTVTVTIGNIMDGTGMAVLSPSSVEAGSSHRVVEVTFTAAGTMDGGNVTLEIPPGWGDVQSKDPTQRNYVSVRGDGVTGEPNTDGGRRIIAALDKLAKGGSFRFIIGSGTGGDSNGVEVRDTVGFSDFTILSDGDGDTVHAKIASKTEFKDREKIRNPDKTGKIYKDAPGILKIKVTSALDGTGTVTVEPVEVRAADDNVTLVFTYMPTQTIEDGALKLTVPSGWSKPQVEEDGMPGYTEAEGPSLGSATDDDKFSVTIPIISLDKDQDPVKITYGAGNGPAMASTVVDTDSFKFEMKGHADGHFRTLRNQPTVEVKRQASGMGKAVLTVEGDALYAGDMDRKITVVYTAAGQMVAGKVRLTIPAKWSAPTVENVMVMPSMTPTIDGQMVMVDGVNLMAGGTVTFVYTGTVQPTNADDVKFAVAVHGGEDADSYKDIPDTDDDATMLTVDVGQARAGSGEGAVSPMIVEAGATGVNIQFTYIAAGITDAPREFRVQVPAGWTAPTDAASGTLDNKGAYSVEHRHGGAVVQTSVEKLDPIGRDMVARVKQGGLEVEAGDEIIFTYENADAPATTGIANFILIFDGKPIADSVQVRVQDSTPSQLSLSSAGTVSAEEGAMPLAITVGLQDADGDAVAQNTDVMVTLTSTSATGAFSMMADEAGTGSATVTIAGGDVSAMAYYMDSTAGTATITATAPGLTMASQEVTVTAPAVAPDAVVIDSVTVDPELAMAGETVTVSAMGSAGQMAMFSVGSIVTDKAMMEDAAGSYSGSFDVVVDMHADGMYDVTVNLGTASGMGSLTIDSTAPAVTVTAPESAANGDAVMISATVTDASAISSVMADVSMLDSTQTDAVALAMGDDGSYSASVTISDENEHANGSKTITVTAMDAAGNSGMGTASVELKNTLSYTSMIPAGISLYHVPLDVDGLDTVGDLKMELGDAVSLVIVYDHATGSWNSRSDDVMITADLGVVLSMGSAAELTLEGEAWGGGASMISLQAGPNLVGLPVNDPRVTNASDIAGLFAEGVVTSTVISTADGFEVVSDTTDAAVMGDAAYLITADTVAPVSAALLGDGWSYSMAGAAPIALAGYSVDVQTPVLDVQGAVVDEITGLAREGFRVKVKNLSTKAALSKVTSVETAEGYNMTFVDLKAGHAARIGDILEISADSPSPLIGVQPVRHIVTADDVKSGILALEDLIAYEIPAETELLRNYPNPFNPETWIPYRLAEDTDVSLTIYDVNGTMVRTIDIGHQSAAVYESRSKAIYWDGRNRFGEQVASGIYFYSLSAGDFSATRKMVILK